MSDAETPTGPRGGTAGDVAMMTTPGGVVENVAVLDLTGSSSPDELRHIRRIQDVAVVLVRESAAAGLTATDMHDVAKVVTVPAEGRVRIHTGALTVSGEGLAEPQAGEEVLIVTGTLVITSVVQRVAFSRVLVTGRVLAPTGSETALATGLTDVTGSVSYFPYREGQRIEVRDGGAELSAAGLADRNGSEDDLLLVTGSLTITGEISTVGYERIVVAGQLIAPKEARDVLEPITFASGTVWYAGKLQAFNGKQTFSRLYFELLDEPVTLVLNGSYVIDDDVTLEVAKEKVAGIVLNGSLRAPKDLVALFQMRALALNGSMREKAAAGDANGDSEHDAGPEA